jgi:hypothetical protein
VTKPIVGGLVGLSIREPSQPRTLQADSGIFGHGFWLGRVRNVPRRIATPRREGEDRGMHGLANMGSSIHLLLDEMIEHLLPRGAVYLLWRP